MSANSENEVPQANEQHPVRTALLDLLHAHGELTSTQAARELGGNTGLYSFHLRKLAEQGLIEDVPGTAGRARPWRLAHGTADARPSASDTAAAAVGGELAALNRSLEDESYQRWRGHRDQVPAHWRRDEAFSEVVYLTPDELTAIGDAIRAMTALFRHRETVPSARPDAVAPVAVVARLFPLLEPQDGEGQAGQQN